MAPCFRQSRERCPNHEAIDWASAYKHIAVRPEDVNLQFFSWLGMDFVELCLVFGCRSSAGLYDRLAKVVLQIVLLFCKFPADMVCQYLDDVCAAAPAGSTELHRLQEAYRSIARHLGVLLAPTTDPDKAFEPCTSGVVLRVCYDTIAWTWNIPAEKLARLLHQIRAALAAERLQPHEVWSVVGRILHYAPLVPGGKFNISELIALHGSSEDKTVWVDLPPQFKQQLHFWWVMLKTVITCLLFQRQTYSQPGRWNSPRMPLAGRWPPLAMAPAVVNSGSTSLGDAE
jgi:hypothetical protein